MRLPGGHPQGRGRDGPKKLAAYFGTPEKPECHTLYNVSTMDNLWSALAARDARLLRSQIDALLALGENCWFVNYLRCHDDIGWGFDEDAERSLYIDPQLHKEYLYRFYDGEFPGSWAMGETYNYDPATRDARSCGTTASLCGLERALSEQDDAQYDLALRRIWLMHGAAMFLQGFMMLSSGDEIGQLNGWGYHDDPDKAADSRNLHRTRFDWSRAVLRGKQGTPEHAIWEDFRRLRAMRAHPCFAADAAVSTLESGNRAVLAVRREKGSERMTAMMNFSEQAQSIMMPDGTSLELKAYEIRIR